MNIVEVNEKLELIKGKLLELQKLTIFDLKYFEEDQVTGCPHLESDDDMSIVCPDKNLQVHKIWEEIQQNIPSGFSVSGNLIRHLSFNQAHDWYDIAHRDIPQEIYKLEEHKKHLYLIEYLNSLHPEVKRVSEIVLNGDLDASLKTVFATLENKIRTILNIRGDESTVSHIGKAFKDGVLVPPKPENLESVRSFLQGVIGYYRSEIIHHQLPDDRKSLESCMSLFALAHETFILLDICSRPKIKK
jgi:hypothetical protein